jgi:hypothetical protein
MPEATVDEHREAVAGEDDVDLAAQSLDRPHMFPKPQAFAVERRSHGDLYRRVT